MLDAPDVGRAIGDRRKRDSPYYNERLATFVRSMQVRSPHEFTLQFSTVPARPQALFRFPVRTPLAGGLADASPSGGLGGQGAVSVAKAPDAKAPDADGAGGNENGGGDPADSGDGDSGDGDSGDTNSGDENSGDTNSGDKDGGSTGSSDGTSSSNGQQSTGSTIGLDTILSRRFRIHEREEDRVAFRRVIPQPESLSRFHVAEIVERKYENHEEAIKGLLRGEVSVLPRVPVWLAPDFERDERFFTKTYGVPPNSAGLWPSFSTAGRFFRKRF